MQITSQAAVILFLKPPKPFLIKELTRIVVNGILHLTRKVVKYGPRNNNAGPKSQKRRKEAGKMPLYNKLKEYRARIGVNQTRMGELAGVSRQTISQIERGDYSPSVTLALKIAKICNAKVEDIFSYEEDEENDDKEKEEF